MIRLFSAQFPLNENASLEDLLKIGKRWISDSPWSVFGEMELANIGNHNDSLKKAEYSFDLVRAKQEDSEFLGLKYINPANGGDDKYHTTIVGFKSPHKFLTSVSIDYDSFGARTNAPFIKKPYIFKLLLENIEGGRDGDLLVGEKPIYIKEGEEEFVNDILRGLPESIMPVIYVSRNKDNNLLLEPSKLSRQLAGIANVLVEPSIDFSFKLKNLMKGYNVYGGAVGAYWPDGVGRYLWYADEINEQGSTQEISSTIIKALSNRRLLRQLTWDNIESLNNIATIKAVKESHDTNLNDLLELYASESENKDRRITETEESIGKLEAELRKIRANMSYGEGLINDPQISQLYKGEVKQIIVDSLRNQLSQSSQNTRRNSILNSVIKSNEADSLREDYINKLKKMFKDYNGLTGKMRSELKNLGFSVSEEGKHYKLYLTGSEGGLSATIPKTPSDWRSGKNAASDIIRTFF